MCVVQKSNRDFLNAVLISLTYDLKDVGRPSLTGSSAHELLDINQFPVVDPDHSATNISVCTCSDLQCVSKKNIPDISSCNSRKHCRIFIIFGTHVTEEVSNQ